MAIQSRVHGGAEADTFHGLPTLFYTVAGTNVGTADTVDSNGLITARGNFSKAIDAINSVARIVYIGARENNGFLIGVDNTHDGNNTPETAAAEIDSVVTSATSVSTTVTLKTMAFSEFA